MDEAEVHNMQFSRLEQNSLQLTLAIMTTKKSFGLILQLPISSASFRTLPEWINFIDDAGRSALVRSCGVQKESNSVMSASDLTLTGQFIMRYRHRMGGC